MTSIRIIVIDDEVHSIDSFIYTVNKYCSDVFIIKTYTNPKAFLEDQINGLIDFDLLFLDIEMFPMSGLDLLSEMKNKLSHIGFDIIFLTAYDNFAIDAFRYNAIDYLLKPIMPDDLKGALEKWRIKYSKTIDPVQIKTLRELFEFPKDKITKLALPTISGYEIINIEQIIRCEADRNYSKIYCTDKTSAYIVSKNLKEVSIILENNGFLRIHHSHLINPIYIRNILKTDGGVIKMIDGALIRMTKNKKNNLALIFSKIPRV
jgi:two-component system, LytTR family, response regulator